MASDADRGERHGAAADGAAADGAAPPDAFLGGRVRAVQPPGGFRAGMDSVVLAASVPATGREEVLDLGCGAGVVLLCLAARLDGVRLTGLERDPALAELARANVALNGWQQRIRIVTGDVAGPWPADWRGRFDHVCVNPPYTAGTHGTAPAPGRRGAARLEGSVLADWVAAAAHALTPGGTLTIIHRTDALGALLTALPPRFGAVVVHPLWPRAGEPARRILVRARAGRRSPLRLTAGTVLHAPPAKYTMDVEAILRDAAALVMPD